jgi:hypothetical protein
MQPDPSRMITLRAPHWTLYFETIAFVDMDFTGATYKMQVRTAFNVGSLLLDLSTAAGFSSTGLRTSSVLYDTVANHLISGYLRSIPEGYELTDFIPVTLVTIRVPKATMVALPFPEDQSEDYEAVYDIWITPAGGLEQPYMRGSFIIEAGSTQ